MAVEINDGGMTITGEHIPLFRAMQVMHGLALEINSGLKLSNRGSVMLIARGMCGSAKRTKKGVLADYVKWFRASNPAWEPSGSVAKALSK